ncbi:MAG: NAD(P)/FAD-dependent oxidoreductase, partial [Candidatus Gastranaerophilales bacterium]|nr:NAD(P)/FAD-dependent oxidoreductase [Candidatus Gastranaerophilales bacterium]
MEQEPLYRKIGIVGCGAAGGLLSILLSKNPYNNVYAFDVKPPFSTLLPTGGGRCNISNAIEDVMDFVKNYPRGEKFLISIFSRFSPAQTLKLFEDLGVKTYVQNDNRVFPISDSSVKTIQTLRTHLLNNFYFIKEKVINIS